MLAEPRVSPRTAAPATAGEARPRGPSRRAGLPHEASLRAARGRCSPGALRAHSPAPQAAPAPRRGRGRAGAPLPHGWRPHRRAAWWRRCANNRPAPPGVDEGCKLSAVEIQLITQAVISRKAAVWAYAGVETVERGRFLLGLCWCSCPDTHRGLCRSLRPGLSDPALRLAAATHLAGRCE